MGQSGLPGPFAEGDREEEAIAIADFEIGLGIKCRKRENKG
jgi:hypothetical protein